MGINQIKSNPNSTFLRQLSHHFHFFKELDDKNFGYIQVYKNNTLIQHLQQWEYSFIARTGKTSPNNKDLNEKIQSAKQCMKLKHDNLLRMFTVSESCQEMLCGDLDRLNIYFEYYFHNLQVEIKERARKKIYFQENELHSLLLTMINVMIYLGANEIPQSNYIPSRIFLRQDGEIKLGNFFPWAESKMPSSQLHREFFSPELMQKMRWPKQNQNEIGADEKSLIFSMAITIIEAASLKPLHLCFNFEQGTINFQFLWDVLNYMQNQYSRHFIKLLAMMIAQNKEVRPNAIQIIQAIQNQEIQKIAIQPLQISQIIDQNLLNNSTFFSNQGLYLSQFGTANKNSATSFVHHIKSPALFSPLTIRKQDSPEKQNIKQSIVINRIASQQFKTPQKVIKKKTYKKQPIETLQVQLPSVQQRSFIKAKAIQQPQYQIQVQKPQSSPINYQYSPIQVQKPQSSPINYQYSPIQFLPISCDTKNQQKQNQIIYQQIDKNKQKKNEKKQKKKDKKAQIKKIQEKIDQNIEKKLSENQKIENIVKKLSENQIESKLDSNKIVEKIVQQIVETVTEKIDAKMDEKLVKQIVEAIIEKIDDNTVEKIVQEIVETIIEKIEEKMNEKIVQEIIETIIEKIDEKMNEKIVQEIVETIIEKIEEKINEKAEDEKKINDQNNDNNFQKIEISIEKSNKEEEEEDEEEEKKQSLGGQKEEQNVQGQNEIKINIIMEEQKAQNEMIMLDEDQNNSMKLDEEQKCEEDYFEKMSSQEFQIEENDEFEKINQKILQAIKQSEMTILKLKTLEEEKNEPQPTWPEEAIKGNISFSEIQEQKSYNDLKVNYILFFNYFSEALLFDIENQKIKLFYKILNQINFYLIRTLILKKYKLKCQIILNQKKLKYYKMKIKAINLFYCAQQILFKYQ